MKKAIIKLNILFKGLILVTRPHVLLGWIKHPLQTTVNIIRLSKWIAQNKGDAVLNDFYTPKRNHSKRYQLYEFVQNHLSIKDKAFDYIEFGVCEGHSIKWWSEHSDHEDVHFYGFDTFEGLPEKWGSYKKGDMATSIPSIQDNRVEFIKGLFQDTLQDFIKRTDLEKDRPKLIHMDADLFSSTIYVLSSLAPYLKKGDVIMFDEFNVPNHEFLAYTVFSDSYYIKTKLIAAVNNYYQVALVIQ